MALAPLLAGYRCEETAAWDRAVAVVAAAGLDALAFELDWADACDATGRPDGGSLDAVAARVENLLGKGIIPVATLHRGRLPGPWQERGGWPHRDLAGRFADHVEFVADRLGDRITRWITVEDPFGAAWRAHPTGITGEPGWDEGLALAAVHHVLLAHGLAVQALRAAAPHPPDVGVAIGWDPVVPATDRPGDVDAADRADGLRHRLVLGPLLAGEYPPDVVDPERLERPHGRTGSRPSVWGTWATPDAPLVRDGDLATIATPIDLVGVLLRVPSPAAPDEDDGAPITAVVRRLVELGAPSIGLTALDLADGPEQVDRLARQLAEVTGLRGEGIDLRHVLLRGDLEADGPTAAWLQDWRDRR